MFNVIGFGQLVNPVLNKETISAQAQTTIILIMNRLKKMLRAVQMVRIA